MRRIRRAAAWVKRKALAVAAVLSPSRVAKWALTSYTHLAAVVVCSLAAMVLLSGTMATLAPDEPADAASSASAVESPSFPVFTDEPEPDAPQESTGSREAAQAAAVTYVDTYLDTSGNRVAWLMRLQPLSTTQLNAGLSMVDPAEIPAARTGRSRILDGNGINAKVRVQVRTRPRTPVDVYLTWDGERWVASDLVVIDR